MEVNQEEMMARLEAKLEVKMDCHHEKFEVLRGILVSWMISTKQGQSPLKKK
jgi:hypothetical protein